MLRYTPGKPAAVIDIGSNSLRLVIYDGLKRVPWTIFNEKVLCGLASGLAETGKLDPEGRLRAKLAIKRFVALSHSIGIKNLHIFATAAIRDAKDGKAFVQEVRDEEDIAITVISGKEEAQLAGQGVASSIVDANGVAGDLGGGSLELISIKKGKVQDDALSLPLGALVLHQHENLRKQVDAQLMQFALHKELSGKNFYAVGGAFRNLAKLHMSRKGHPLKVLQNYAVPKADFLDTLSVITKMSEKALIKMGGVSSKRARVLPVAAIVAERIIERGNPAQIVVSTHGVREGFVFKRLPPEVQQEDPLMSGAEDMIQRVGVTPAYGHEVSQWIKPLFKAEKPAQMRLRKAACVLSEISRYENTEYRAELAYRRILDSSLIGLTHKDRIFVAKSVYHRYRVEDGKEIVESIQTLLSYEELNDTRTIGYALRLAQALSGCHVGMLSHTSLLIKEGRLILTLKKEAALLKGESIERRLLNLADWLDLEPVLRA